MPIIDANQDQILTAKVQEKKRWKEVSSLFKQRSHIWRECCSLYLGLCDVFYASVLN